MHWLLVTTQENERKARRSLRKRRKMCVTLIVGNRTRNLSIGNRCTYHCTIWDTHTHTHTHAHTHIHTHAHTHIHTHMESSTRSWKTFQYLGSVNIFTNLLKRYTQQFEDKQSTVATGTRGRALCLWPALLYH